MKKNLYVNTYIKLWVNEEILRLVIENLSLLTNGDIDIIVDRLQEYTHKLSIEEVIENVDKTYMFIMKYFPEYNGEELVMGRVYANKHANIWCKGD